MVEVQEQKSGATQEQGAPAAARLIALSGTAGAGKSTVAARLVELGWERVKFADPLKNMLRTFYRDCGLSPAEIEDRIEGGAKEMNDGALLGCTPRHAMQALGTEWGRVQIHQDLWVHAWERRVRRLLQKGVSVVSDDCRFENEAESVRRLGGQVVQILRTEGPVLDAKHVSEAGVVPDFAVTNDGSIETLRGTAEYVFHQTYFD